MATALTVLGLFRLASPHAHMEFNPPPRSLLAARQDTPTKLDGVWLCRQGGPYRAFAQGRVFYPPSHPLAPPLTVRPAACFADAGEARTAGYAPAPPPPQSIVVDGVYLVPVGADVLRRCQLAANMLKIAVPCPAMLPVPLPGGPSAQCDAEPFGGRRCTFNGQFFLAQRGFPVPPGQRGLLGSVGNLTTALVITALRGPRPFDPARNLYGADACSHLRRFGSPKLVLSDGVAVPGGLFECKGHADNFSELRGSDILMWSERGVAVGIASFGHVPLSRHLLLALAGHLPLVPPA